MRLAHQVGSDARKNLEKEGETYRFLLSMFKIQNDLKIPHPRWMSVPTWFKDALLKDTALVAYFEYSNAEHPTDGRFGVIMGYALYEHSNKLSDIIYYGYEASLAQ